MPTIPLGQGLCQCSLVVAFYTQIAIYLLLTREAIEIYLVRLTEEGVLVFHISNRYYDIRSVLKAAAKDLKMDALWTHGFYLGESNPLYNSAAAFVMTNDMEKLNRLPANKTIRWERVSGNDGIPTIRTWTDDYVNILIPLWERLASSK